MLFKTLENIPGTNIGSGETGYGCLVGVGPDEFRYMMKFLGGTRAESSIVYLPVDSDLVGITDPSDVGVDVLENASV